MFNRHNLNCYIYIVHGIVVCSKYCHYWYLHIWGFMKNKMERKRNKWNALYVAANILNILGNFLTQYFSKR